MKVSNSEGVRRKPKDLLKVDQPIPDGAKVHTVKAGQNLESIAKEAGISVKELKEANPRAGNLLYAGDELLIVSSKVAHKKDWVQPYGVLKKYAPLHPADIAAQHAAIKQQENENRVLAAVSEAATYLQENGSSTTGALFKEAVRTRDWARLNLYDQVFSQAMPAFGDDRLKAAQFTGAAVLSHDVLERINEQPAVGFSANFRQVTFSEAMERAVKDVTPKGHGAPTPAAAYSTVKPSVELGEAILYKLQPNEVPKPKIAAADTGTVEAELLKKLHQRYPQADIDLVLMAPKPSRAGGSPTGEVAFLVTHKESQLQGLSLHQAKDGGFIVKPNEKVPFDASKLQATIVGDAEGVFLVGKAKEPGFATVKIGDNEQTVNTDEEGNWRVPLDPSFGRTGVADIVVTEGHGEMYRATPAAERLVGDSEAIGKKLASSPDELLGGYLEKLKNGVDWSQYVATVPVNRLIDGKTDVEMQFNAQLVNARSGGHAYFYKEHANEIHAPFFMQEALAPRAYKHWVPENFESNVLKAMGYVPERDANDPEWAKDKNTVVKAQVDALNKLYQERGGTVELNVTALPMRIDLPDGSYGESTVLRVDTDKGPLFLNDNGAVYPTIDEVMQLPPSYIPPFPKGTVATVPANGKLELDEKRGMPKLATFVTP